MFGDVSVVALCTWVCVCICIPCLNVYIFMSVFWTKYMYFCNMYVKINYTFIIFIHLFIDITHTGPIGLVYVNRNIICM